MSLLTAKRKLSKLYLKMQFKRYGRIYKTDKCELNYLFIPKNKSNKLLIVFSGFGEPNQPAAYNYVRSIQGANVNRLYILDNFGYDKRGAYYLGKDGDFFIEDAVQRLINDISRKNKIKKESIITGGSSKGGYAALYFGLKYGYGEILSGAPQTLLGDYLIASKTFETLRYVGGENQEGARKYLNKILFDVVKNNDKSIHPEIKIHVGKGDHHYKNHVLPFVEFLDDCKIAYELDIADYTEHGDVGIYYPTFVLKNLK